MDEENFIEKKSVKELDDAIVNFNKRKKEEGKLTIQENLLLSSLHILKFAYVKGDIEQVGCSLAVYAQRKLDPSDMEKIF